MKRITLFFILLCLLLASCTTGQYRGPTAIDYYVGNDGLQLEFLEGLPPNEVNEDENFEVHALVHNLGAYDVVGQTSASIKITHDSAILDQLNTGDVQDSIELMGKSINFRNGQQEFFVLGRYSAGEIFGSFERMQPTVYATLCYPYQTSFAREICVDTDIGDNDPRTQACEVEPVLTFGEGQGAPIAVSRVETTFEPIGPYVTPAFTFTIQNRADGIFYLNDDSTCQEPNEDTIYQLEVIARLGNDTLTCPETVRLQDGEAEIDCYLDNSQLLGTRANYVSTLSMQLNYRYVERFSHEMELSRRNQYSFVNTYDGQCAPWDTLVDGECVSYCEYCATNSNDPECLSSEPRETSAGTKRPSDGFACIFTSQECQREGDACINEEGYCVPGLHCGVPDCVYDSRRNDAPNAALEPSTLSGEIIWSCSDDENDLNLASVCGCALTSEWAPAGQGIDCPDTGYQTVEGTTSASLRKTFYSITQDQLGEGVDAICVKVMDVQGKTDEKKLNLD